MGSTVKIARNFVLALLQGYKWAISPWLPASCRYVPTCSEYAMEAVQRFGALRGTWMALARLLRCHPFAKSGFDPVVRDEPHVHTICGSGRARNLLGVRDC